MLKLGDQTHRSAISSLAAFLRVPPFPGAKVRKIPTTARASEYERASPDELLSALAKCRVGGTYWAAQPSLPQRYILVRSPQLLGAATALTDEARVVLWTEERCAIADCSDLLVIEGECDPWHMLCGATALVSEPDEVCAVAAIIGVPIWTPNQGQERLQPFNLERAAIAAGLLEQDYANPFSGERMSSVQAVELCAFWRSLIDSNRVLTGGLGFAFWKHDNVAPLLWNGSEPFHFMTTADELRSDRAIAVWQAKAPADTVAALKERGTPLVEVEDGFIRSQGLGADCVPPLSITVDRLGAHFDPGQPSELEELLQNSRFDEQLVARARELRALIVEAGVGKYERGSIPLDRPAGNRQHILVPGQVEDDRAVQIGGNGLSNLALLHRVRQAAPEAFILYKPHPDVLAGHRKGSIPRQTCLRFADDIVADASISSLIAMVDEVHVNTSLAGFEALMREKQVTTYGVPFYAGWGLTSDKGDVPSRRTARRTIDELVAAALLLYPRYLDPITGLPCPAEVVVQRLSAGAAPDAGLLVSMRRLQGKVMRGLRSVRA